MPFIITTALDVNKYPATIRTTNPIEKQLFNEMESIRYLPIKNNIHASRAISPWIDQAKIYYLDAFKSNWRSAGLLYYYSFLNLAKACIVGNKVLPLLSVQSTSIHHGLSSKLQGNISLLDYEVEIHPKKNRAGTNNVFACLYESLTGIKWPFKKRVTLALSDIAVYSKELITELENFYEIDSRVAEINSLFRVDGGKVLFEFTTIPSREKILSDHLSTGFTVKRGNDYDAATKDEWFVARRYTIQKLSQLSLFCLSGHKYTNQSEEHKAILAARDEAITKFKYCAFPPSSNFGTDATWLFYAPFQIASKDVYWHPILSDYLISFALSTILRYEPQLFSSKGKDLLIARSWCEQATITVLRYFLQALRKPPLIVDNY